MMEEILPFKVNEFGALGKDKKGNGSISAIPIVRAIIHRLFVRLACNHVST